MHTFPENRTSRGWSNLLWQTCPYNAIRDNPRLGFVKQFNGFDWGPWFVTRATSGTVTTASTYPGILSVTAGAATDAQGVTAANPTMVENIAGTYTSVATGACITPAAGRQIWLEAVCKQTLQTSTLNATWFGLATIAEGLSTAGAPAGTDRIGFLSENAASVLFNYKDAGDSEYEADTTFDYTSAQWVALGFYIDGLRSVTPYINGRVTSLGTIVAGQAPGGGNGFDIPDDIMTICVANVANGGTGTPLTEYSMIRVAVFDDATSVVTVS